MQLPPDFKEFLQALSTFTVEYLLVGGFAVSFHGYPRTTADIDVWIAVHPDNARRMMAALRHFGFGGSSATEELFLHSNKIVRMGVPPLRITILTTIDGVRFAECYARRVEVPLDDATIYVISRQDLIANKQASGRAKDIADLEQLAREKDILDKAVQWPGSRGASRSPLFKCPSLPRRASALHYALWT